MYETDYRHVFEFDTLGRISVIYETKKDDGTEDTVFQIYQYNTKEELIYFSRGTRKSYRYVLYLYDEKSALVSSEFYYHHTKDDGQISTLLERKESYIYEIDGIDTIKITRNSYNFPYKKEWKMYDRHGHVTKIEERFLSNGEGNTEMFEFNTEGFLETKTYKSTKESYPKNILTFDYDTLGNVLEKKIWYQNSVTREIQFVYNEENGQLSAILEREKDSEFISIIRFQEYFLYSEND